MFNVLMYTSYVIGEGNVDNVSHPLRVCLQDSWNNTTQHTKIRPPTFPQKYKFLLSIYLLAMVVLFVFCTGVFIVLWENN